MRAIVIGALLMASVSPWTATGQNCDELLRHGIYNVEQQQSSSAAVAVVYQRHSGRDLSNVNDKTLAEIEIEVFGAGRGDGSLSIEKRREDLREWFDENRSVAESHQEEARRSQTIYKEALSAWNQCNELNAQDIEIQPTISPDGKTVDISIRWKGATARGLGPELMAVSAHGFTKSLEIYPSSMKEARAQGQPVYLTAESVQFQFKRDAPTTEVLDGTTFKVTPSGTISILTGGKDLQIGFVEEWNPPAPQRAIGRLNASINRLNRDLVPVGTVVAWAGMPDALPSNWKLANGEEVAKERYPALWSSIRDWWGQSTLTTFRLPDLRGQFLRGVDGGAGVDPDGQRRIGSKQADALIEHKHAYQRSQAASNRDADVASGNDLRGWFGDHKTTEAASGTPTTFSTSETRPKNVAVYWIIRVE